jgi:hypothetical protein
MGKGLEGSGGISLYLAEAQEFCSSVVENGYLHKSLLAEFIAFFRFIYLFTVLYKKDERVLCTDCVRLRHVHHE